MPLAQTLIFVLLAYLAVFLIRRDAAEANQMRTPVLARHVRRMKPAPVPKPGNSQDIDMDAVVALRTLGYTKTEAVLAVRAVLAECKGMGTAELVKAALQQAMVKAV